MKKEHNMEEGWARGSGRVEGLPPNDPNPNKGIGGIMFEYKVISPLIISGASFQQAKDLENILNDYAQQGWRVVSVAPQTEFTKVTVVLEKDVTK